MELAALRQGERRKCRVAMLLREKTTVGNEWIAVRLGMGHPSTASRSIAAGMKEVKLRREIAKLLGMIESGV